MPLLWHLAVTTTGDLRPATCNLQPTTNSQTTARQAARAKAESRKLYTK